jgi:hypothetical protein
MNTSLGLSTLRAILKRPIQRRAADRQRSSDLSHRLVTGLVQLPRRGQLFRGHHRGPSAFPTASTSSGKAGLRPFNDQRSFKLAQGAEETLQESSKGRPRLQLARAAWEQGAVLAITRAGVRQVCGRRSAALICGVVLNASEASRQCGVLKAVCQPESEGVNTLTPELTVTYSFHV